MGKDKSGTVEEHLRKMTKNGWKTGPEKNKEDFGKRNSSCSCIVGLTSSYLSRLILLEGGTVSHTENK